MTTKHVHAIVIGAGMAGIAMGVSLRKAGINDFVILEKGDDVGGVWHWNHYPGLTCDVPSHLYQYSFAPKPDWSRLFATGPEIQRYHRAVAEDFGLMPHVETNAEVVSAVYSDGGWDVETATSQKYRTDFLISATGVLHHPAIPDIDGLESFDGPVVHTARWDDDLVTDGKRIAVIGTGSTGVQVVSALQSGAAQVTHFTRTPQWILWGPMDVQQPKIVGSVLGRVPFANKLLYRGLLEGSGILADITTRKTWRRTVAQNAARVQLLRVRNRQLRRKLTPDYEPFCKRQVVSGAYYTAVQQRNVELVDTGIERVTENSIVTADGRDRKFDIIVLATGFQAHNYMRPMNLVGRDGLTIDDAWAKGPRGYRMTAIPGFPNFFTLLGPNSPTGSVSLQFTAELTSRYIIQIMKRFRRGEFTAIEPTQEAADEFNDEVREAIGPTIWNTGGCNSWYQNEDGTIDLWPWDRKTMAKMLSTPDDRHYHFTR
ncbi:flavin-containing monooxygenase [Smaragdicoccus niigatensis]|uniref:flavin-containing monooxygenase n=1 Tax=Smaragdicoccus niigatensis TaxID=359359 RepID=UPI00035C78C8|nr:NAD(P)/FAD-dependent oxidoreductase [Smaragdicoccus niigatensis]